MSASSSRTSKGPYIILVLAIILGVIHQDLWLWSNDSMVFGFIPAGLAYHAGFSLCAAGLWALAMNIAWPTHLEEFAEKDAE